MTQNNKVHISTGTHENERKDQARNKERKTVGRKKRHETFCASTHINQQRFQKNKGNN
jgi:hypothetical protein